MPKGRDWRSIQEITTTQAQEICKMLERHTINSDWIPVAHGLQLSRGGTTSLCYVTRKRINNEHSDRARDTSMPVEDF